MLTNIGFSFPFISIPGICIYHAAAKFRCMDNSMLTGFKISMSCCGKPDCKIVLKDKQEFVLYFLNLHFKMKTIILCNSFQFSWILKAAIRILLEHASFHKSIQIRRNQQLSKIKSRQGWFQRQRLWLLNYLLSFTKTIQY